MSDERDNPDEIAPRRIGLLARAGIGLAVFIVLILAGVTWTLATQSGARWAAHRAVDLLGGKLEVKNVSGTLIGPLNVEGIRWHDAQSGIDARIAHVSLDIAMRELLALRGHVQMLDVRDVDVQLSDHPPKEKKEPSHFSLEPPIDLVLDSLTLRDVGVSREGKKVFVARTAEAAGRWTHDEISVQKLLLDSPDGNVRLNGQVSARGGHPGQATGSFRWTLGDVEWGGDLTATSANEQLVVNLRVNAPFAARLDATLGESEALPWKFDLQVPTFDPRKKLLHGDSLQSLAATLRGSGDLTLAEVRGSVTLNGQPLRIEPARVRFREQVLAIEQLKLIDPAGRGSLGARGDVRFGPAAAAAAKQAATPPPFFANLVIDWQGVELPKEWVGQPLGTHGEIRMVGSPAAFTADGRLALGPPDHLADIVVALSGTPEEIEVKQIDVDERTGKLSAQGVLHLRPPVGWQFTANATRFDPGQLIVDWPGKLDFSLETQGELAADGPSASLDLTSLSGTLRGRTLSGQAALTLSPKKVLAGTLDLRSNQSTIHLGGERGEALDLQTDFRIASLDDWVPGAAGRVRGRFHISGTWPALAVEGSARARRLAFGEYSAAAIDVSANVKEPKSPQGSLHVTGRQIVAAGFTFSDTTLELSGSEQDHTLQLSVKGEPLTAQMNVHGSRDGDGWSGTVNALTLAVAGIDPLSLRSPANVSWSPRGFSVSESCLADTQITACLSATQNEAGELNASYRLEHLPLGLIASLAAPTLPLRIEAVIDGEGTLKRTSEGQLFGNAQITSDSGRISEAETTPQEEAPEALLTYNDLRVLAQLSGDTANGSIEAKLGANGSLDGRLAVADLGGASPSLEGSVKLAIGDLSPAGLFVPQLAEVRGAGEANAHIAGTLANPQITGDVALRELAAEVPQLGIKLHDGAVEASMLESRDIRLNGKLSSGEGQLDLTGRTTDDRLRVTVQGKDFVAANIPGAKVFIDPNLTFERSTGKMTLGGTVTIPRADIDLAKLPRQGANVQHASPDVVVIDDEQSAAEKSKNVPLEAHVTVILGSNVNLVGYGLTSKVEGQLVVHELPGSETTANGEVRVSGKYKAYGQDLTVERGRLLYVGQAITDPQLNLTATRTVDTVTAKLIVTGSARKPLLEVASDPPMPQSQALSYLVTGKPLNEVGSGEGDMVQSAARSLGGAAGNLLAKSLGKRLGIDEIGIEDTPEAGGSAFTVGEYLSPRLYLSYGVGLFEPGQVVTLRYRLNRNVSLEAVQGTISQRAGINYRVEKK